jgi:hypothetical protein
MTGRLQERHPDHRRLNPIGAPAIGRGVPLRQWSRARLAHRTVVTAGWPGARRDGIVAALRARHGSVRGA